MSILDPRDASSLLQKLRGSTVPLDHTVQVTTFGGTGTTMLYSFLDRYDVQTPQEDESWPYKHLPFPPSDDQVKDGFRALYMFTNPMNAVLSVFRRGFQHYHARNTTMDESMLDKEWTLPDFLAEEEDPFQLHQHFRNWTQAQRSYPIMLLKFGALWDHLPEVFAFLGLPSSAQDEFPEQRERSSDWTDESKDIQAGLESFYGDLRDEIDAHPDVRII